MCLCPSMLCSSRSTHMRGDSDRESPAHLPLPSAPPSGNPIWPPCPLTKMKGLQVGTDRDNSWALVLQV